MVVCPGCKSGNSVSPLATSPGALVPTCLANIPSHQAMMPVCGRKVEEGYFERLDGFDG